MPNESIHRPGGDKNSQKLSSLHTLTGDTKEFLKEKNVSLAALIAQSQKYEKAKTGQKYSYGFYVLVGFIVLLVAGGSSFWFLRGFFLNNAKEESPIKRLKPLFPVYEAREILVGTQAQDFVTPFRKVLSENILPGRMVEVIVKNKDTKKELALYELFSLVDVSIPNALASSFGRSTTGIFGTIRGTEPVIIVSISSFEKTLAGMLEFEKLLPGAFFNFLPTNHPVRRSEFFDDRLIANQEARILKTIDGRPLFAYAFFSRKVLILAVSQDALTAVINNFILIPPML